MATQKITQIENGGYFFTPLFPGGIPKEMVHLSPDEIYPYTLRVAGKFVSKHQHKKNYIVTLGYYGKMVLYDYIMDRQREQDLYSALEISVSKDIFNYPFRVGGKYQIFTNRVEEL